LLLIMERNGYPEETYFTFSYSPIPGDDAATAGILCACTEDTQRIIGERQMALLRDLAARTGDARTIGGAGSLIAEALSTNPRDLPSAAIYLLDADRKHLELWAQTGFSPESSLLPTEVALDAPSPPPMVEVVRTHKAVMVGDLARHGSALPKGAWDRPPSQAIAVPIAMSGETSTTGVLIAGLNPYRLFDDQYRGFVDLVAGQIAACVANVQAYEMERRRAESLAELDRAKTTFFSNVSHEFRTPLTTCSRSPNRTSRWSIASSWRWCAEMASGCSSW
jgi:GAF domain-containing protein